MEFLTKPKEYGNKVLELIKTCESIKISSYGIYAGIGANYYYPNIVTNLLNHLRDRKIKNQLMVSYYCAKGCPACGSKLAAENYMQRLELHFAKWQNLNFYLVRDCHLKAVLAPPNHVILGGINPLTSSGWTDMSVYFKNQKIYNEMEKQFDSKMKDGIRMTEENFKKVLASEGLKIKEEDDLPSDDIDNEIPF